jgi:hypothetical protein
MTAPLICRFCGREIELRSVVTSFGGRTLRRSTYVVPGETSSECRTPSGRRTLHDPKREKVR